MVLLLGVVKMELIRSLVSKVVSNKKSVNIFSIVLLIALTVVPTLLGFSIAESDETVQTQKPEPIVEKPKTKEEAIAENAVKLTEDVITMGNEIAQQNKEERREREVSYNSQRQSRWVYQIGDRVENDDDLLSTYNRLTDKSDICLFEDNKTYFLFRNRSVTKSDLESGLQSFKAANSNVTVGIIDLMEYTSYDKPNISATKKRHALGKRKEKVELPCFSVHK